MLNQSYKLFYTLAFRYYSYDNLILHLCKSSKLRQQPQIILLKDNKEHRRIFILVIKGHPYFTSLSSYYYTTDTTSFLYTHLQNHTSADCLNIFCVLPLNMTPVLISGALTSTYSLLIHPTLWLLMPYNSTPVLPCCLMYFCQSSSLTV